MGGWSGWYNTGKLCWELRSLPPLCWQHESFYLGFRSELLITVIRAAAINNVLGRPVCQCKINMVPGQAWTLRTTHGLYCIKLKHAETD